MTEMHDVVEMILNRMKDYPEDFVASPEHAYVFNANRNKWERALDIAKSVAAPHEKEALDIRFEEAKRAVYMGAALKTILSDDEPEEEKDLYRVQSNGNLIFGKQGAPVTMPSTNTNMISELEARVKAQEAQMQRQYAMSEYSNSFSVNGSALG